MTTFLKIYIEKLEQELSSIFTILENAENRDINQEELELIVSRLNKINKIRNKIETEVNKSAYRFSINTLKRNHFRQFQEHEFTLKDFRSEVFEIIRDIASDIYLYKHYRINKILNSQCERLKSICFQLEKKEA